MKKMMISLVLISAGSALAHPPSRCLDAFEYLQKEIKQGRARSLEIEVRSAPACGEVDPDILGDVCSYEFQPIQPNVAAHDEASLPALYLSYPSRALRVGERVRVQVVALPPASCFGRFQGVTVAQLLPQ